MLPLSRETNRCLLRLCKQQARDANKNKSYTGNQEEIAEVSWTHDERECWKHLTVPGHLLRATEIGMSTNIWGRIGKDTRDRKFLSVVIIHVLEYNKKKQMEKEMMGAK